MDEDVQVTVHIATPTTTMTTTTTWLVILPGYFLRLQCPMIKVDW